MIVYTASFGGRRMAPNQAWPGCEMHCFSDIQPPKCWHWHKVRDQGSDDANTRAARKLKAFPWAAFGDDWDSALWLDANYQLTRDPRSMPGDMAIHRHRDRDCVYEEARICTRVGKDAAGVIAEQTGRYMDAGYPEHNGLWETAILFRRNTEAVKALCKDWWQEIESGSRRDQISLPVVASCHSVNIVPLDGTQWRSPWAKRHKK